MEQLEKNQKMGFTKFPDKVRKIRAGSQPEIKMTPSTKFVYLAISWSKGVNGKDFHPSYTFMKNNFGICGTTYQTALDQLEEAGWITYSFTFKNDKKFLTINMLDDKGKFEKIPSVILTTETLTTPQKLFMALMWKTFYIDDNPEILSTTHSVYDISMQLAPIGISKRSTYMRIKELSDPESGYINLLTSQKYGGHKLNYKALVALFDYESKQWDELRLGKVTKYKSKPYTKPKAGDFKYEDGEVIKLRKD